MALEQEREKLREEREAREAVEVALEQERETTKTLVYGRTN